MTTTDFNRDYKAFCRTTTFNGISSTTTDKPMTATQLFALDSRINRIVTAFHSNELHTLPMSDLALLRYNGARPSYDVLVLRIMSMTGRLSYVKHSITIYSK